MTTRDFKLKLKTLETSGAFTGLASTYGNTDLVGDVIEKGAFTQAIRSQGAGYPLLFGHDQTQPLGMATVADSAAGLVVDGKLVLADPNAVRVLAHMRAGSIKGLSIGFQIPDGKFVNQSDGTRLLKEIKLFEVSLVAIPANPLATVTSVKTVSRVLEGLRTEDLLPADRTALVASLRRLTGTAAKGATECGCDCPQCLDGDCAECSDEDCADPNCAGSVEKAKALRMDTLYQLQAFARELRAR